MCVCVPVDRKYRKKAGEVRGDEGTDLAVGTPATPAKLRASDVRSTAVTIAWTQPDPPECCPIVAYRIMIRNLNSQFTSLCLPVCLSVYACVCLCVGALHVCMYVFMCVDSACVCVWTVSVCVCMRLCV